MNAETDQPDTRDQLDERCSTALTSGMVYVTLNMRNIHSRNMS